MGLPVMIQFLFWPFSLLAASLIVGSLAISIAKLTHHDQVARKLSRIIAPVAVYFKIGD